MIVHNYNYWLGIIVLVCLVWVKQRWNQLQTKKKYIPHSLGSLISCVLTNFIHILMESDISSFCHKLWCCTCVLRVTERCDIDSMLFRATYVKGGNIDYVTQASHFRNTILQDKITSYNWYADHAKNYWSVAEQVPLPLVILQPHTS